MPSPGDQSRYQVRFEWGAAGLARLEPADVTIVVDVLDAGGDRADDVIARAQAGGRVVLAGDLRTAARTADAVLAEQHRRGRRTSIAVVALGEPDPAASGVLRFAVEDLLGAGAVIDALASRGIDHSSPEAAAACESFRGLRLAVRHLLTASATGQAWIDAGRRDAVLAAAELDADS